VDVFAKINEVKSRAYKGAPGSKRKRFCDEYSKALRHIHRNINVNTVKRLKEGEVVSCKKGCTFCCRQHIGVPFAQALLVVDYLYSHEQALLNFISNYSRWHELVGNISENIDSDLQLSMRHSDPNEILSLVNNPLFQNYLDVQVPCPLLQNNACSIYEVRPFNCAQHISISPNDRCSISSSSKPTTKEIRLTEEDRAKLSALPYVSSSLLLLIVTLPTVTYKLLVNGLPYFSYEMGIEKVFV